MLRLRVRIIGLNVTLTVFFKKLLMCVICDVFDVCDDCVVYDICDM